MKPKEVILDFVDSMGKYPPSAEKKQRKLVFGECGGPAESASDKAGSR